MNKESTQSVTTQHKINDIWGDVWEKGEASARDVFKQRLFIEGYPIFKKYIPSDIKKFLEVGAGSGRYGLRVAEDFPAARVTLTDIVESSLAVMGRLRDELGLSVEIQREDVFAFSFPDDSFDVVFCDAVVQHLPDADLAMEEMRRVLKPGGLLVVSTMNARNPHSLYKLTLRIMGKKYNYGYEKSYTRAELRDFFIKHRLSVTAEDGFYPAYGIFRLKKYWKPWALIGRLLNRINSMIDPWTGRFISRHFGFEIFCVGRKPVNE